MSIFNDASVFDARKCIADYNVNMHGNDFAQYMSCCIRSAESTRYASLIGITGMIVYFIYSIYSECL
jgi:hypothetical protein